MSKKEQKKYVIKFRNQHPDVRCRRQPVFFKHISSPSIYGLEDHQENASVFTDINDAEKVLHHISGIRLPSLVMDMTYLQFFYLKLFGVTIQDRACGLDVSVSDSVQASICEVKNNELSVVKNISLECSVW